jgi:hypothetical protein
LTWSYTDVLMVVVFGGYHLVYAACISRHTPKPAEALPAA